MNKVKMYVYNTCPFCIRAIQLLEEKGVNPKIIAVSRTEVTEMSKTTGMSTVPQIFINEQLVGGHSDLVKLDKTGELDELLK